MELNTVLPGMFGFPAEKGVVSRKNGFGSMDNGADGFVVPKLQEQAEFVHVFWKFFVWPALETSC